MKKSCFRRSRALFTLFLVLCLLANTVIVSAQPATPPQPAPGYGVVLLSGVSQNTQTMPAMLWVANDGQDVYVAIKSNHDVNEVIFGSHSSTDLTVYAPGQFIVVEGKQYDPKEGLSGTIQKAHWTLARFDGPATPNNVLSQVEQDESGSYIIFTVWVGSWSPGQSVQNQKFYLLPYTGNQTATKNWNGGSTPRPDIYFQLHRTYAPVPGDTNPIPDPYPVPDAEIRMLPNGIEQTTWQGVDITDVSGRKYVFSVVEGNMVGGVFVPGSPGNYEKTEEGLTVTNSWLSRNVNVTKNWDPSIPDGAHVTLRLTRYYLDAADSPVYDTTFEKVITLNSLTGWNHSWNNLEQKDANNNTYIYALEETDKPASYETEINMEVVGSDVNFEVTNTFIATSVTAKKIYVIPGQDPSEGPVVGLQLLQDGNDYGLPKQVTHNQTVTWNNLPKYMDMANTIEHKYTVTEPVIPGGYVLTWEVANGVYVMTNTYRGGTFSAKKTWDPEPVPDGVTVTLKLYRTYAVPQPGDPPDVYMEGRDGILDGTPDTQGEFAPWSYQWTDLPGNEAVTNRTYKYYVTEGVITGAENYVYDAITSASTAVINRSLTTSFTATKIWKNGPKTPYVVIRLMRTWPDAVSSEIAETVNLTGDQLSDTWSHTWSNLPRYKDPATFSGEYTYYIEEVVPANYTATYSPYNYPNTVTNAYKIPTAEVTATKVWVHGPKPTVYFRLYRHLQGSDIETRVEVPEAEVKKVPDSSPYEVKWANIQQTNLAGTPYVFTVVEVNQQGFPYTPPEYEKTESELMVTNTYVIPKGSVTANKVWRDGPADERPTVWFKLYRTMNNVTEEVDVDPLQLVAPATQVSWPNIEQKTINGEPYTFSVVEGEYSGGVFTAQAPANYFKYETGTTVTNYYQAQTSLSLGGTKTFTGRQATDQDTFTFELYASDAEGNITAGAVPLQSKVLSLTGETTNYTFNAINYKYDRSDPDNLFDDRGDHYYVVKESAVNPIDGVAYSTAEYLVKVTVAFTDTPDGKLKLTATINDGASQDVSIGTLNGLDFTNVYSIDVAVEKIWEDQNNAYGLQPANVEVELLQGVGSQIPVSMNPQRTATLTAAGNWKHTFTGLPFEDADGNEYVYTVKETSTVNGYTSFTDGLILINTLDTVNVPVEKKWAGGDYESASRPESITLELLQNGNSMNPAKTVVLNEGNYWKYTFLDLPETDANGDPYTYTVREVVSVPGYATSYSTDKLTVTNTLNTLADVTATKQWLPAGHVPPAGSTVELTLSRAVDGESPTVFDVVTLDGVIDTALGSNGSGELTEWIYTWKGLPAENTDGKAYTYSVEETNRPASYSVEISGSQLTGFTVANSFQSTSAGFIKKYESGTVNDVPVPLPDPLPTVGFHLYQDDIQIGSYTLTGEGSHTWSNLPLYKDNDGNKYTYTITEPIIPDGFIMTSEVNPDTEIITFTNTFLGNTYTAKKEFRPVGTTPPAGTVEVWFQLYQKVGTNDPTPIGAAVPLDGVIDPEKDFTKDDGEYTPWSYIWHELDSTVGGMEAIYYVLEVAPIPDGYYYDAVSSATDVIINYSLKTEFTATKNWVNGSKPDVEFQLWRTWEGGTPEQVGSNVTLTGEGTGDGTATGEMTPTDVDTWHYKWVALDRYYSAPGSDTPQLDLPYTYYVREVRPDNYNQSPTDGTVTDTITNTYEIPLGSFTADKKWVNANYHTHPDIWFQLWRTYTNGIGVEVTEVVPQEEVGLPKPVTNDTVTWIGLKTTTIEGYPYTFSVVEGQLSGEFFTAGPPNDAYDVTYGIDATTEHYTATNTYSASGILNLTGTKAMTGRALRTDDHYTFTVKDGNDVVATGTNNGTGTINFTPINYVLIDMTRSPITLTVTEDTSTVAGVTADTNSYTVTVTLTDNGDGTITATPAYPEGGLVLTNTYAAIGYLDLTGTKAMNGRALNEEKDQYTFTVKDGDQEVATGANNGTGTITFTRINYSLADVARSPITLTVTEDTSTVAGVTADTNSYTVTVTLTDNGDGTITATPTYPEGGLVLTNTYSASGSLALTGTKAMTGRNLTADDHYTFTVKDGNDVVATGANNGTGAITFTPITYELDDLARSPITLKVTEDASTVAGVIADTSIYDVTVTLTDNGDGTITATAEYPESGLKFTNTYSASHTLTLQGNKVMVGRDLTTDDHYTFTVKDGDKIVATGTNKGTGIFTFTPIDYSLADVERSPITLTVTEDASTVAGVTADPTSYEVTVTLTDNGDGTLDATPAYPVSGLVFTNTYEASGTLVLTGNKVVLGRDLTAEDKYTFTVKDGDTVVATGANNGTGTVTFTPITYTLDDLGRGSITLTVTEEASTVAYVTADHNSYTVMVALTDNGDGTITATPTYPEGGLKFLNSYVSGDDIVPIPITGESSGHYPWLALMLLTIGELLLVLRKKRKISKQKD